MTRQLAAVLSLPTLQWTRRTAGKRELAGLAAGLWHVQTRERSGPLLLQHCLDSQFHFELATACVLRRHRGVEEHGVTLGQLQRATIPDKARACPGSTSQETALNQTSQLISASPSGLLQMRRAAPRRVEHEICRHTSAKAVVVAACKSRLMQDEGPRQAYPRQATWSIQPRHGIHRCPKASIQHTKPCSDARKPFREPRLRQAPRSMQSRPRPRRLLRAASWLGSSQA